MDSLFSANLDEFSYENRVVVNIVQVDEFSYAVVAGIKKDDVLKVCCGGRGRYHYNLSVACGDEAATTCEDPPTHLFWDGVHLTEAAYHHIAQDWLNTILSSVPTTASS